MYIGLHIKYSLFLSDFNQTWIFSTYSLKILTYQISWKSSGSWRERHDKANSCFLQFLERANKFKECGKIATPSRASKLNSILCTSNRYFDFSTEIYLTVGINYYWSISCEFKLYLWTLVLMGKVCSFSAGSLRPLFFWNQLRALSEGCLYQQQQ
jgi:hypothetical protein